MWTRFFDRSSGGSEKLDAGTIWIEAAADEAVDLFEQIFGRDPHNVTCTCCGPDYSIFEEEIPDIQPGQFVVTSADIERFHGGHMLIYNAGIVRLDAAGGQYERMEG